MIDNGNLREPQKDPSVVASRNDHVTVPVMRFSAGLLSWVLVCQLRAASCSRSKLWFCTRQPRNHGSWVHNPQYCDPDVCSMLGFHSSLGTNVCVHLSMGRAVISSIQHHKAPVLNLNSQALLSSAPEDAHLPHRTTLEI